MTTQPWPDDKDSVLECRGLSKAFGGLVAVDDMSLKVQRGTITGLIGPNGAGKSTLFNLVSGVIRADHGEALLFGEDITRLKPYKIARKGMIRTFQLSREMSGMTVLENIMLAAQNQIGEKLIPVFTRPAAIRLQEQEILTRAREVLDMVKLTHVCDEYAGNLSGGQKKLLELARALMINPDLILLDEPAAGVNPSLMGLLMETIAKLNQETGKTFLIVEHDMELVKALCHHVVVMAQGRHLIEGSFHQVTHDAKVMEAYLGVSS